ncbi:ABC transporter ATP-binding protein [Lutimaribacter saemankumensis]|uniref:ABC-type bacteriocin/lantibiotic exporter, contains an N-terminal double-glycine peptidase domain n=1 Tax=Lutimaribacter saemankumensis TaxID=490829 RepID=A0A1G8R0C8_9RHOB|nr:ABC transporter ATP-binding protein [Lutimaribacter saemankumensis]SDJ10398.1 ABC-type bacteriocin/lantibiotic exporter, contains an N-terminal double-glycine peptidase domain [Lutimaribacter saemankumensis]
MIDVFKKVMALFDARERRKFFILAVLMVFVAFAEVFGISTLLVLLRVLADPQVVANNAYLSWAYETFGFSSMFAFQIGLSLAVLMVLVLSLVIKAGGTYAIIRFASMRGYAISSRMLEAYLHQPYAWFLQRNSAEVSRTVLGEVQNVVAKIIEPGGRLLANILLSVCVIGFLVAVDPLVAIFAAVLLGGGYAGVYAWLRGRLLVVGHRLMEANRSRFRLTQEATGGFKEIKLMALEQSYVDRFRKPARSLARNAALSQVMNQAPRFALEGLTYAVLLGVILILLVKNDGDLVAAVPTLGVFGASAMRLLPAMQQIYMALASIRAAKPVLDHVYRDYTGGVGHVVAANAIGKSADQIQLKKELVLDGIEFGYSGTHMRALNDLSLSIPALTTVGFVGGTGAGKTTVVDVILGLLTPEKGQVIVDGNILTSDNLHLWRRSIGYVPQSIYLTDSSIAENIAFGVPPEKIDMNAVIRAARTAALHDFVVNDLAEQYETLVGERGVRLSGGQRQRIGIARALYHDPSLLILDEATSALDNVTERAVMEAVQRVRDKKTVIMIAHRLSTIRNCDRIFLLERGQIRASGTYEELLDESDAFRKMAVNE